MISICESEGRERKRGREAYKAWRGMLLDSVIHSQDVLEDGAQNRDQGILAAAVGKIDGCCVIGQILKAGSCSNHVIKKSGSFCPSAECS